MNFFIHPTSLTIVNIDEVTHVLPMMEDADNYEEGAVEVMLKNGNSFFLFPSDDNEVQAFFNRLVALTIKK